MGTAEEQRVDTCVGRLGEDEGWVRVDGIAQQWRQRAPDRGLDLRSRQLSRFDQGDQLRGGVLEDLDERILFVDGLEVGVGANGGRGGDDSHRTCAGGQCGSGGTRTYHAEDRQCIATAEQREGHSRRGVAGHHDRLHVALGELVEALDAEAHHLFVRSRTIGRALVVPEIERVLSRQASDHLTQDGQAADPGVEEADGSGVAHRDQRGVCAMSGATAAPALAGSGCAVSRCTMSMIAWLTLAPGCARTKGTPSAVVALTSC